jgi:hypothetical protein
MWGEPVALSVTTTCAEREPDAAGVKSTEIEQLAPARIVVEQLFVSVKSVALAPDRTMLLTVSPALPVLLMVIAAGGLVTPID